MASLVRAPNQFVDYSGDDALYRKPERQKGGRERINALGRAAQYVRMSTELQEYSIANQSAAIALYAAAHDLGIFRSFVDAEKTGTTIRPRRGLQELIRTVESGAADFDHILVYDVSRWGRFPDADESASCEYLLQKSRNLGSILCRTV